MKSTITRRSFLKSTAVLAAASTCPLGCFIREPAERPNILFFLIDDQRNDTLGCAGHPVIKTPVIDNLAAEGVRFTNAFVTTSICAASRASILTGLYERTHGYTFGTPPLRESYILDSYPSILRNAGYRTGFIGKLGINPPKEPSTLFDYFKPLDRNPYFKKVPDGSLRHETDLAGDSAIEFLNSQPEDQPFCLSISFNAVHAEDGDMENHYPYPESVEDLYKDVVIPPPRLNDPAIFESQPEFLKHSMNRLRYFWRWDTQEKYQKNMKAYFRMISAVDNVIGRIRRELDKIDFSKNTIIFYMADNGYYMGDRGFAGKWSHYEESLRIPLIIYDPRQPRGNHRTLNDSMALNIDVPATMLDFAGIKIPYQYQGRSLVPLLQGKNIPDWRKDFFCEHLMNHEDIPKWEGVRGERFMYARYFEQNPVFEFLHDLKNDPDELVNLASNPQFKDILRDMRKRCDELKEKYENDVIENSNDKK